MPLLLRCRRFWVTLFTVLTEIGLTFVYESDLTRGIKLKIEFN
jgi:hypothetical protein